MFWSSFFRVWCKTRLFVLRYSALVFTWGLDGVSLTPSCSGPQALSHFCISVVSVVLFLMFLIQQLYNNIVLACPFHGLLHSTAGLLVLRTVLQCSGSLCCGLFNRDLLKLYFGYATKSVTFTSCRSVLILASICSWPVSVLSSTFLRLASLWKKKWSYPCNRPWRPIGLWDVKDPTLSRQSAHRWQ
jgi:hypothetical protein